MSLEPESESSSPASAPQKAPSRLKALLAIAGVLLIALAAVFYFTRDKNTEPQLMAKSLDELKKLASQPSANALVYYVYARKIYDTGDLQAVKEPLGKAMQAIPKGDTSDLTGEINAFSGYEAFLMNDVAFAQHCFDAAERIGKNYAFALAGRGAIAMKQQKTIEAIDYLSRATQVDPKFGDAWKQLGRAYILGAEPALALPALRTAARLSPKDPTIQTDIGQTCLLLKNPKEAVEAYQLAATLSPSDFYLASLPLRARAFAARTEEEYQKVAMDLENALTVSPNDDGLRAELAGLNIRFRRFPEARKDLETILTHTPFISVSCWENLYMVCQRMGDAAAVKNVGDQMKTIIDVKALSYTLLEQAQLHPQDGRILFQLAKVLLRMGKKEQGFPLLARAYKMAPQDPEISQAMQRVQAFMRSQQQTQSQPPMQNQQPIPGQPQTPPPSDNGALLR